MKKYIVLSAIAIALLFTLGSSQKLQAKANMQINRHFECGLNPVKENCTKKERAASSAYFRGKSASQIKNELRKAGIVASHNEIRKIRSRALIRYKMKKARK